MGQICDHCKKPVGEDCLHCPYCGAELNPYGTLLSPPLLPDLAPPGRPADMPLPPPAPEAGHRDAPRDLPRDLDPSEAPRPVAKKPKPKPRPAPAQAPAASASHAPPPRPAPAPPPPQPQPQAPPPGPYGGYYAPPPPAPAPPAGPQPAEGEGRRNLWGKLRGIFGQAPDEAPAQAPAQPPPGYGPPPPGAWPPGPQHTPPQGVPGAPWAQYPAPGTQPGWGPQPGGPPPQPAPGGWAQPPGPGGWPAQQGYPPAPAAPPGWEQPAPPMPPQAPAGADDDLHTRQMSGADLARLKIPQYRFSLQILDQGGQWREWEKIGVGGLKLGRSKGGPSIPGLSTMAVRHVRFYYEGGGLMVENLESVNGVYVRLTEPVELEDGRRFRVGNHVIDFRRAEPVQPVEPLRSEDEEEYWSADLGVVANLEFIRPDGTLGVRFPFLRGAERIVLGRGSRPGRPVDIPLPHDEWVSGSHAQVRHDSGRFFLEDLQSTNGTFIQLREPTPIKANDILMVGRVLLRIVSSAAF